MKEHHGDAPAFSPPVRFFEPKPYVEPGTVSTQGSKDQLNLYAKKTFQVWTFQTSEAWQTTESMDGKKNCGPTLKHFEPLLTKGMQLQEILVKRNYLY